jgi:hypothetical protein
MKTSTTPHLPLIAKIGIAMTFVNTWVIFEETVVDRHSLWRYMPFYRVGLFCVWDAAVLAVTLLLLLVSVAPFRRRSSPTLSTTPPLPLIAKIAIAMTFLNTLVILFGWPGVLLRVCL